MNNLTRKIIDLLINHPDEWTIDEYTLIHKSGVHLWIANGLSCYRIYSPFKYAFSVIDKFRLHRAVKQCKLNQALSLLNESQDNSL